MDDKELYISSDSHDYPLHIHERIVTGYVSSGYAVLYFLNSTVTVTENDLYVIFPFTAHRMKTSPMSEISIASFDSKVKCGYKKDYLIIRSFSAEDAQLIFSDKHGIGDYLDELISKERFEIKDDKENEYLRVKISDNYTEPNNLDDINGTIKSKFTLLREFRKDFGVTPSCYKDIVRIRKAKEMLRCGMKSTEAAYFCGYFDQSHFIKKFKKYTGLTPEEYKKKTKGKN